MQVMSIVMFSYLLEHSMAGLIASIIIDMLGFDTTNIWTKI